MVQEVPKNSVTMRNVPAAGQVVRLDGDPSFLGSLARAVGVHEIDRFSAVVKIMPWGKHGICLEGAVDLDCRQACVITGDLINNSLQFEFERRFLPDTKSNRVDPQVIDGEWVLDPEGEDPPDLVADGKLDLWEVIIEEIDLHLELFPRSANADSATQTRNREEEENAGSGHFSELKALITEKKTKN